MSELKHKFRASNGLDASGDKVINVALADRTVMSDGVNVQYFYQENTIQEYDPTRTYIKGFAVMYARRIWVSQNPVPAGPFNEAYWRPLRNDPKWYPANSGARMLQPGDYLSVDTSLGNNVEFTLPSDAQEGDIISVVDIGGNTGYVDVVFKAGLQSIMDRGKKLITAKMTVPYSEYVFIYMNRLWNLYNKPEESTVKYINTTEVNLLQPGDNVIRVYDQQRRLSVKFPKNANHGDIIHFLGVNTNNAPTAYYNMLMESYDNNTSIWAAGTKSKTIYCSKRTPWCW